MAGCCSDTHTMRLGGLDSLYQSFTFRSAIKRGSELLIHVYSVYKHRFIT